MKLPSKEQLTNELGQKIYDFQYSDTDVTFSLNMEKRGYTFGGEGDEVAFNLDFQGRLMSFSNTPGCETYFPDFITNLGELDSAIDDFSDWLDDSDEDLDESEAWKC